MKYSILFTVEILHDYYMNGQCADFEIRPCRDTINYLAGQKLIYKNIGNKLVVLIETDSDNKPVVSLSQFKKLSFYLKLLNPEFYNFSNLNYQPGKNQRYYFSNAYQTKLGTVLYLSSQTAAYNSGTAYKAGDFTLNGSNDVFEAIKPSSSGDAHALNDTAYWIKRGKFQYVNDESLVEVTSLVYTFETTPSTNFSINVFAENPLSGNLDLPVDTENKTFNQAQSSVQVRLEKLPKGRYCIEVNGQSKVVYLDSDALYSQVLGILEIVNIQPASNAFSLIDGSGKLKQPRFNIRFANRLVYWKYQTRTADIKAVNDSRPLPDKFTFSLARDNQFISDRPLPLNEVPVNTISVESTALGTVAHVANPGTARLTKLEKDGVTYYCAETNLNY